ncbi:MAG: sugar phosphate isomerase/epimerase [Saprospiraceae bacterium]|nr:sugar phosphate isomerase/epimerase [Saprospiraceae bacterium]
MKKQTLFLGIILCFHLISCKQQPKAETEESTANDTFRSKVGLQLYSLRDQVAANLDSALAFVQAQGITDVELAGTAGLTPEAFKAKLDQYGLKPSSAHYGMSIFRDSIDKIIAEAKIFGIQYVGTAWIDHKADTITFAEIQEAVKVFNEAGKKLKENGLQFFYHVHGFEFSPYQDGTYFDYLYNNTDPENVKFEEDVFWVKHGGQDPIEFLKKYGSRVVLFHIKDMDKTVVTGQRDGQENVKMDVPWGTGQIDIKGVCLLGKEMGIEHFYLEDESPTVLSQIPQSLKFAEGF